MISSGVHGVSCLVDTDIIIDFLRRREYAKGLLQHWSEKGLLAISTITHLEVYQGMKTGEELATNAFLDGLVTIVVDVPTARLAGKMISNLRSKGVTAGMADGLIAATALRINAPLITNNIGHYPFKDLRLIKGF